MAHLEECLSCQYANWVSIEDGTEPKLDCNPPMSECPAEFPNPESYLTTLTRQDIMVTQDRMAAEDY